MRNGIRRTLSRRMRLLLLVHGISCLTIGWIRLPEPWRMLGYRLLGALFAPFTPW